MMENKLIKAFISYSRKDSDFVNNLSKALQLRGIKVWLDRGRIRVGKEFNEEIFEAISDSDVFILVVSRSIKTSEWVKKELEKALSLNQQEGTPRILPILIDNSEMPTELQYYHYSDFQDSFERPLNILLKAIFDEDISTEQYKSNSVSSVPYKDTQQNEAIIFYNRGIFLYQQGKLDEAVKCFMKAYELDPHNLDIPYNLAVVTYDLALKSDRHELMELAASYYEDIIKLRPDDVDALVNLGVIYNTLNAFEKQERARALFERAISIAPDYALAYLNLGHYYCYNGGIRELEKRNDLTEQDIGVTIKPDFLHKALLYYVKALELDNNLEWQCRPMYTEIKKLFDHLVSEGLI